MKTHLYLNCCFASSYCCSMQLNAAATTATNAVTNDALVFPEHQKWIDLHEQKSKLQKWLIKITWSCVRVSVPMYGLVTRLKPVKSINVETAHVGHWEHRK